MLAIAFAPAITAKHLAAFIGAHRLLFGRRTARQGIGANINFLINTGTIAASFVARTISHRIPFKTAVGIIVAAGLVTIAGTYPLPGSGTLIGAGRNTRTVIAGLVAGAIGHRSPL